MSDIFSRKRVNRVDYIPAFEAESSFLQSRFLTAQVSENQTRFITEVDTLYESCVDIITDLFDLSAEIYRATNRDRYARAIAAKKETLDDSFDISHVSNKFPKIQQSPWLERRLGQAITRRRYFFRYCKAHVEERSEAAAFEVETVVPAKSPHQKIPSGASFAQKVASKVVSVAGPTSTKLSKATTFEPSKFKSADQKTDESDDAASVTSFATSLADIDGSYRLKIPLMPPEAAGGRHFQCPYCWSIQKCKKARSWKYVRLDFLHFSFMSTGIL